jgi:LPS export ABC transporter protein LptC
MTKLWFLLTLLFFLAVLAIYLNQESDLSLKLKPAEGSYMDNVSIKQTNNGIVKWLLDARRAVFINDANVQLSELTVTFPEKGLVLFADSGKYDVENRNLDVRDNIKASTKDYDIVATQLFWNSSDNELTSNDKVKIIGKRFSVQGDRLTATPGKAKLSHNVKAVFDGK